MTHVKYLKDAYNEVKAKYEKEKNAARKKMYEVLDFNLDIERIRARFDCTKDPAGKFEYIESLDFEGYWIWDVPVEIYELIIEYLVHLMPDCSQPDSFASIEIHLPQQRTEIKYHRPSRRVQYYEDVVQ